MAASGLSAKVGIQVVPDFSVDGGDGKAGHEGDGTVRSTVVIEPFDDKAVRLCHTAVFGGLFHHSGLLAFFVC